MKRAYVTQVAMTIGALTAALVLGQEFLRGQEAPAGQTAPAGREAPAGRAGRGGRVAQQAANPAEPRAPQVPLKGKIERIKIYGESLAGNLMGESDSPYVSIYLPQSYATDKTRRYPVIYFLHGYNGEDLDYLDMNGGGRPFYPGAERVFNSGQVKEMIFVIPNCNNVYGGCMWSNSPTSGYWENYVADDLVAYMDKNYRTLPTRESRGIAGQSMGGYGAMRIGMKRPDVFSVMWAMAPCCLNQGNPSGTRDGKPSPLELIKTFEEAKKTGGVGMATAAAWSPNPNNPPLYVDLPTKDGKVVPEVAARYAANSPLAMLGQYGSNLKKYKAVTVDVGVEDGLLASIQQFDARMKQLGIPHEFSMRAGNHGSHVVSQWENKILPYFAQYLSFEQNRSAQR